MAKTRKRSRPTGASKRAKLPAKRRRRKTASSRQTLSNAQGLDLRALRGDLEKAVAVLGRRTGLERAASDKVVAAQTIMTRWMTEIDEICEPEDQEICGPTMWIPLS